MSKHFYGFPHVMVSQQFSREWLETEFFPLSDEMEKVFHNGGCDILKGKRMVSLFFQPSTRTKMSSEMAMDYLGGKVVFQTENAREFSSAAKGESFSDGIRVATRYRPDVINLRYDRQIAKEMGATEDREICDKIAAISATPIINAGDRSPGQHPTQGLLDIRTIKKCHGEIDGKSIVMAGDLWSGRTVRSLCYQLGRFKHISINFVSPKNLQMQDDVKDYLHRHGVSFTESTDLRKVVGNSDVVYQTRTQVECGSSMDKEKGYFIVNGEILSLLNKDAIIMHPLPRGDEITEEVDKDPRAVYLTKQIDSGLVCRMALFTMIMGKKTSTP